jgi:threonine/homoserine/homoserine lactone efflux protein
MMFGTHDIALFVLTALALAATPGADMLLILTRTFQNGFRGGILAAAGALSGCAAHTAAAALGLVAMLATSPRAFIVIKLTGAAYLLWLAAGMLRQAWSGAPAPMQTPATAAMERTASRVYLQGFVTNVLNPKVALFYLALLPQFIDADAQDKPLAFLFLGALFILVGALFLFALVTFAARVRGLRMSGAARRVLHAISGGLFVLLAVRLAQANR